MQAGALSLFPPLAFRAIRLLAAGKGARGFLGSRGVALDLLNPRRLDAANMDYSYKI